MNADVTNSAARALELRARVMDAVRREPSPTRAIELRRNAIVVGAGFAAAALLAAARSIAVHANASASTSASPHAWHVITDGARPVRPLGYVLALELAWMLVAAGATWVGIVRGRSMLGRSTLSKFAVAFLTPLVLLFTWLLVAGIWRDSVLPLAWLEAMGDGQDTRFDATCAILSAAYALGPLAAFVLVRLRRCAVSPAQTGAAMGAAAGAWGAAVHFPFCQCTSSLHVALGHVLPVALLAVAGALLGRRFLAVTYRDAD